MSTTKRIVIIDDHQIVRKGLRELLQTLGDYEIIKEYNSGLAFLEDMNPANPVADLYLIDHSMPMLNGVEAIKEALEVQPDLKFLMLTQHLEEDIIDSAYRNGARGFLNKNCTARDLQQTIDNIIQTGYNNVTAILKRLRDNNQSQDDVPALDFSLTDRELDFITYVCNENEFTYQEIADRMNLSVKSIDACRAGLFSKLEVKSKVGFVLFSFRHKLTVPFLPH